ncbi:IS1380 family transposase [Bdellovibrionota bacterium FG-1]
MKQGEGDEVTARAGLPLVVETARALGLNTQARELLGAARRECDFGADEKIEAICTLIAAGGDRIEDIKTLGEDKGLVRLIGRELPSPDALLDFLNGFHDPRCWEARPAERKAFVPKESEKLQALKAMNHSIVLRGADEGQKVATIDHDGTIIESHKKDALRAYEGTRGYQPLVAVWAEEQLIVADEFRDGNVGGGDDPLTSAKYALENLPTWVETRYFRGDSASYYAPLLKYLSQDEIGFCISADMTQELRKACLALPTEAWLELEKREHEEVVVAEVEFTPGNWPKDAKPLRYVALRFTPLQGDLLEKPLPRYHAVVSNRLEMTASALIEWHRGKAGTIEHVHRVMKDELGAGVMPSQHFGANAAWFRLNAITFNLLTVLKRKALPARYRLARPKRLRFELFTLPGKISVHQSQVSVAVSANVDKTAEIITARERLLKIADSLQ